MCYYRLYILLMLYTLASCNNATKMEKNKSPHSENGNLLTRLMEDPQLAPVTGNLSKYRLQVIYTQINRDAQNKPTFTDFYYNVDTLRYFYPASTVKLPAAILALEKLNDLNINNLDKFSAAFTRGLPGISTAVNFDSTAQDFHPSIAHYIKKIFLVSDNDAFNRLYEFLGQEEFNRKLWQKGFASAQIRHRLDVDLSPEANRHTNGMFFMDDGDTVYQQPGKISSLVFQDKHDLIGKAHYIGDSLVRTPMDFYYKNHISLVDLHHILRNIIFPGTVTSGQAFRLKEEDYRFLYRYMSQLPTETTYPAYDSTEFYPAYVKFLLFGGDKNAVMPPYIRIFNKPGWAYGFLTDLAYVVDFKNKVEFMVSANLYVNEDGVLSSGHYEFDEIGKPFLQKLGSIIYQYELERKRLHEPDLSKFMMTYDR